MTSFVAVGVGGAGCNATTWYKLNIGNDVKTIGVNTDLGHLKTITRTDKIIQLGKTGQGAGKDPVYGAEVTKNAIDEILEAIGRPDVCIVTFGLGGGTGSGGGPVILEALKKNDILNVASVTLPFEAEGAGTRTIAQMKLQEVIDLSDFTLVQSNEVLYNALRKIDRRISLPKSFNVMDRRLAEFIDMIRSLDRVVGLWNVDFMDYRNLVKKNPGLGFIGHGRGETIMKALEQSLRGQMLDVELYGAAGALLNIQACEETPMEKIVGTINEIKEEYGIADIKPGVVLREDLPEVLVVATRVRSKIVENILQGRIVYAEKNRV